MSSPSVRTATPSSLQSLLDQRQRLTAAEALAILRQLLEQVRALHAAGKIHRDLRAEAVLLDAAGIVTLTAPADSCSLTGEAGPPELGQLPQVTLACDVAAARQVLAAAGSELDPCRIDLYQLGALLCRMLTGQPVAAYLRSPKVKALVPVELQGVLDRALGYDPAERFADIGALAAALEAPASAETPLPVSAVASSPTPPAGVGPRAEPSSAPPFTRLGHYQVLQRIGHGGMGDVFLGFEEALQRQVALKVLPAELARNDELVRRFQAEAAAVAQLAHPHVVPLHFFGKDGPHYYFAMQYVEGESLDRLLARRGRLDVAEVLTLLEQCLSGLGAAHQAGLVHRDVKPGNILLDGKTGRALVADFGLVKSSGGGSGITATGTILGTVDYLAPEQARGGKADARSDLYSLGVVAYQLMSGRLPFEAETPSALLFLHAYEAPPPLRELAPEAPASLIDVVTKLMAKDPAERYQSCAEVQADLQRVRAGQALTHDAAPAVPIVDAPPDQEAVEAVAAPPRLGWWQRLLGRVQPHAPGLVSKLQDTTQQVDGALAVYQERRDRLASLVQEARAAAAALAEQVRGCQEAVASAATPEQKAECESSAAELETQAAEQRDQSAALEAQLVTVDATLVKLRNQRDLLNARLRVAEARLRLEGTAAPRRRTFVQAVLVMGLLVVIVLAGAVAWFTSHTKTPELPPEASVVPATIEPVRRDKDETPPSTPSPALPRPTPRLPTFPSVTTSPVVPSWQSAAVDGITCIAFTPNTKLLVTCNAEGRWTVWELGTYRTLRTFAGQRDLSKCVAVLPDSRHMLASEGNDLRLWDLDSGTEARTFKGHTGPIRSIALSKDGQRALTAGTDRTVRIWDVASGKEEHCFDGHHGAVYGAALSPDGTRALSGGPDFSLRLWDVPSGKQTRVITNPSGVVALAWLPDGRSAISIGFEGTMRLWDLDKGVPLYTFPNDGPVTQIVVATDGSFAVSAGRLGYISVWDLTAKKPAARFRATAVGGVSSIALSANDNLLASAGADNIIKVWSVFGMATHPSASTELPASSASAKEAQERFAKLKAAKAEPKPLSDADITKALAELDSKSYFTYQRAAERLAQAIPDARRRDEVAAKLETLLKERDSSVRTAGAKALKVWGTAKNVPALIALLRDDNPFAKGAAFEALGGIKDPRGADAVAALLPDFFSRRPAIDALKAMGASAEKAILPLLKHYDEQVRSEVCKLLADFGTKESLADLTAALADSNAGVAREAEKARNAVLARASQGTTPK